MANSEHLEILKQGVEAWNKWRDENPDVKPDLSRSQLGGFNIQHVKFVDQLIVSKADRTKIGGAKLSCVNFVSADLHKSNLFGAFLCQARLDHADLQEVDLRNAELSHASFVGTNLSGANISGAIIKRACGDDALLRNATLTGVDMSLGQFKGMCLQGASMVEADCAGTNFDWADMTGAFLGSTSLECATLRHASLQNADLKLCNLVKCDLRGANLTGAHLYGTARDEWIITNLECAYVYWDYLCKCRSPEDRDFEPGEFEKLYAALPFFEYVFEHGMSPIDPLVMELIAENLRERKPEWDIKIDSINARGLMPSIRFTVQHEEHKELALVEVRKEYEIKLKQLESERDRYWEIIKNAFDKPRELKLITAGPGAIVAMDGSTVNIQQHIHNALNLQKAIANEPEESESFVNVAKKTALDVIGEAMKDIAKGQVKEAAKQIVELGKDLGPIIAQTAAYAFFKSIIT